MPNKRKRLQGRVVNTKMDKTVVVAVERTTIHPLYKKSDSDDQELQGA